jgi:hypothetical protein
MGIRERRRERWECIFHPALAVWTVYVHYLIHQSISQSLLYYFCINIRFIFWYQGGEVFLISPRLALFTSLQWKQWHLVDFYNNAAKYQLNQNFHHCTPLYFIPLNKCSLNTHPELSSNCRAYEIWIT